MRCRRLPVRYVRDDCPMSMGRMKCLVALTSVTLAACGSGDNGTESSGGSDGPAWSAARTSEDGMSILLVFTGAAEFDPTDACTLKYRGDVQESEDSVTIGLIAIRHATQDSADSDGATDNVVCPGVGYPRWVTVALAEPLGDRHLIDARTGAPRPAFDGSMLLEPSWLPEGWVLRGEGTGYPLADTSHVWSRGWGLPGDDPFDCTPGFALIQGTPSAMQLPDEMGAGTQTATYDVNGAMALHTLNPERLNERLAWISGDIAIAVVATTCGAERVDVDSLLRFARGLG